MSHSLLASRFLDVVFCTGINMHLYVRKAKIINKSHITWNNRSPEALKMIIRLDGKHYRSRSSLIWICTCTKVLKVTFLWCDLHLTPFPTYNHFVTPLQQTTFEDILTKGEVAQYEQFLLLPQCFHLFLCKYTLIYKDFLRCFQVVCCWFPVCGKRLTRNIMKANTLWY